MKTRIKIDRTYKGGELVKTEYIPQVKKGFSWMGLGRDFNDWFKQEKVTGVDLHKFCGGKVSSFDEDKVFNEYPILKENGVNFWLYTEPSSCIITEIDFCLDTPSLQCVKEFLDWYYKENTIETETTYEEYP